MSICTKHIVCSHLLNDKFNEFKIKSLFYINPHHIFNIEDNIHYNTLKTKNYDIYESYITNSNQKEHSVLKFKELIDNFDISKMKPIQLKFNYDIKKYVILDGVHRLSILIYKKILTNEIPIQYLDIIYDENSINAIKQKLHFTTNQHNYNHWHNRTEYGYHSYNINNINIVGQRVPKIRLSHMKKIVDFKNKTIIDFGCNSGSMLFHMPEIKKGYGLDYSKSCIMAANFIKNILNYNNTLNFYVQDLNEFKFNDFLNKINETKVDIILLLSLGSWVKNWEILYTESFNNSESIILETNNDIEGAPQLLLFNKMGAKITRISNNSSDDTTGNMGRKTYLITK